MGKIFSMRDLIPGRVMINVAEFFAELITIATFAPECSDKLSYHELDSTSTHLWIMTDH